MSFHTKIRCLNMDSKATPLVALPGGPGLSGHSLAGIGELTRSFRVYLVDPPGTGEAQPLSHNSVYEICDDLEKAILDIGKPVVILGHSFGGIYALEIALRSRVPIEDAVVVGTPLTMPTYKTASTQYAKWVTPELKQATEDYERDPSNQTFQNWLKNYGVLFFHPKNIEAGKKLIGSDSVDVDTFRAIAGTLHPDPSFVQRVKDLRVPKVFIAGEQDRLLTVDVLKGDAEAAAMKFVVVPDAGHFCFFDQPVMFADLIEEAVLKRRGK